MENNERLIKKLLASIRVADYEYGLIKDGDKILLGISGGKDSLALAYLLSRYSLFRDKNFTLAAVHLDFGFPYVDFTKVKEFIENLNIPYIEYDAKEVFSILSQHKSKDGLLPCSICSRIRKAIINKAAKKLGFKKVAFAHHIDDCLETLFLNMLYTGRVNTFEAKMHLDSADIDFIRPLILAEEKDILSLSKRLNFPTTKNSCGNDKRTKREEIKTMLQDIYKQYPDSKTSLITLLNNSEQYQLLYFKKGAHVNDLFIKKCDTLADFLQIAMIDKKALEKDFEDFSSDDFYYLLRKEDEPIAYLKIKAIDSFDYEIKLCTSLKASKEELITLIDIFEKNMSMKHVPYNSYFVGKINRDVFLSFGYEEKGDKVVKKITKALKI